MQTKVKILQRQSCVDTLYVCVCAPRQPCILEQSPWFQLMGKYVSVFRIRSMCGMSSMFIYVVIVTWGNMRHTCVLMLYLGTWNIVDLQFEPADRVLSEGIRSI